MTFIFQFYLRYAGVDCSGQLVEGLGLSILSEICLKGGPCWRGCGGVTGFQFYLRYASHYKKIHVEVEPVEVFQFYLRYASRSSFVFSLTGIRDFQFYLRYAGGGGGNMVKELKYHALSILSEICVIVNPWVADEAIQLSILSEICCVVLVMVLL